jgi:5'(3')-deoxyribonucleotidase
VALRLGIDLDGVVADFNSGWMRAYNQQFGAELTPDLVQFWDELYSLTHFADMNAFWDWARDHGGHSVFRHLEPYPDAIDVLRGLNRRGHDIVVVTSKPDWAIHDTLEWLADHRIPTREIHFTYRKYEVACDVYLDDSPYVLPEYVEHRPDAVTCRFVRPWNDPLDGTVDVAGWLQFRELVHEVAGGDTATAV